MTKIEAEIKELAKIVAKTTKKPFSYIEIPYEKETPYTVTEKIPVTTGWFIFERTEYVDEIREVKGSTIDFKRQRINGWILRTFYEDCDEVCTYQGLPTYMTRSVSKTYYVLKKNGELVVMKLGYDIQNRKTMCEKVRFWKDLTEEPLTYQEGNFGLGSAYLLDYKPIKWKNTSKKLKNETRYFRRNTPFFHGTCEYKGESYPIYQTGEGIKNALEKLLSKN